MLKASLIKYVNVDVCDISTLFLNSGCEVCEGLPSLSPPPPLVSLPQEAPPSQVQEGRPVRVLCHLPRGLFGQRQVANLAM